MAGKKITSRPIKTQAQTFRFTAGEYAKLLHAAELAGKPGKINAGLSYILAQHKAPKPSAHVHIDTTKQAVAELATA